MPHTTSPLTTPVCVLSYRHMKTVTIPQKEYKALQDAKRRLERMAQPPSTTKKKAAPRVDPLVRLAEGAFDFWDNPDDAIYDRL